MPEGTVSSTRVKEDADQNIVSTRAQDDGVRITEKTKPDGTTETVTEEGHYKRQDGRMICVTIDANGEIVNRNSDSESFRETYYDDRSVEAKDANDASAYRAGLNEFVKATGDGLNNSNKITVVKAQLAEG